MFKLTLFTTLAIAILNGLVLKCPPGSGQTMQEPCRISAQQLQVDEGIIIDIPSSIGYAEINCGMKGCEKKVTAFLGATRTRVICPTADSCLASRFYCARGPPDQNQALYRGSGTNTPLCILDADNSVSSVAKEAEFIVFSPGKGLVKAIGDVAFGTATYRCYSNNCDLECGNGACVDTDISAGDKPVNCIGDCPVPTGPGRVLFPPIIAKPDNENNCIINADDLGITDSKTKIVFKNNCVNAQLNCDTNPGICEKRKIYCGAQNNCNIQCGGADPQKLNENPIPFISGPCKEAEVILGPFLFGLPHGTNEADYDRPIILGEPTLLNANINLQGSDAAGKSKISAVLTNVFIDANGAKTFGEGLVTCGFNGKPPDNKVLPIGKCTLTCNGDNINGLACEKCRFIELGGIFNSIGESCSNAAISNRIGVKQNSVLSQQTVNNVKNVVIPVKSIWLFLGIVGVIIFIVIVTAFLYKKYRKQQMDPDVNNKSGLMKYDTMNELISVETR